MVVSPGRRGSPKRTWVQVVAVIAVVAVVLSFVAGLIGALL
jgi:hypothetical protein